ncbi:DEAH-box RNA helicase prp16 [Tulasnella sp. 419]|nr:DEAH-box RNA helicase prp16 [Tulasnella sp. 419]
MDSGSPPRDEEDPFVHALAIKLSRALNTINPNDLLAKRVIDIAKTTSEDGFMKAAKSFGKFKDSFLTDVHSQILDHQKQLAATAAGHGPKPVIGMTVHDSEVLEPEPIRRGGLMRPEHTHTFRTPAKPIEPPTPRASLLGLDKLAQEKRAASQAEGSRKKAKLDLPTDGSSDPVFKVPSMPASKATIRQRGEETPSHPGGLSDIAKKRLEEHRRNREQQKEGLKAQNERREDAPRGLGDFQRRSNRDSGWNSRGRDRDYRDRDRDRNGDRNGDRNVIVEEAGALTKLLVPSVTVEMKDQVFAFRMLDGILLLVIKVKVRAGVE